MKNKNWKPNRNTICMPKTHSKNFKQHNNNNNQRNKTRTTTLLQKEQTNYINNPHAHDNTAELVSD